jgi:hypothetical protein
MTDKKEAQRKLLKYINLVAKAKLPWDVVLKRIAVQRKKLGLDK